MVVNTLRGSSRCLLVLLLRSQDTLREDPRRPGIQAEAIPVIPVVSIRARANQAALHRTPDRANPVTHRANILALVTVNQATLAVSIRAKASPGIPADDIPHQDNRVILIHQLASILVREDQAILRLNIQVQVRVTLGVITQEVNIPAVTTLAVEATPVVVIPVHTQVVTLQLCTPLPHLKSLEAF